MLYVCNNRVFTVTDDGCYGADVIGVDKVREVRELESVQVKKVGKKVKLPANAVPATIQEIVAKFNISEKNPCKFSAEE